MGNVRQRQVLIGHERVGTKEYVTITDSETGEIIDGFWRERREKPSGRPPERQRVRFFKVYEKNWADIIDKKKLTFQEVGVFMTLLRFIDWESNFLVHPKTGKNLSGREIAELLGVDKNRMNDYLNRLNDKGLLAIIKRGRGAPNHYILNTNVVFKGNMIREINEHNVFDSCAYEPVVRIKYKERESR